MIEKADRWEVGDGYGTYVDPQFGHWVLSEDYEKLYNAYELQVRENLALEKLLDRVHKRLDELKSDLKPNTEVNYVGR